jgi:hypothetical protein
MADLHEVALEAMEGVFGDRLKRRQSGEPAPDGELASVFPTSAPRATIGGWPRTASGSGPSSAAA